MIRSLMVVMLLPVMSMAEDKKVDASWREDAKSRRLKPAQIDALASQMFVIDDADTYKQVFTPYIGGISPVFITSDSVLNAYHVVLEESIFRLEKLNSTLLPVYLEYMVEHIDETAKTIEIEPALLDAAKKRARIIVGTALRLQRQGAGEFDEATARIIDEEIARVTAAKDDLKPAWLGPKEPRMLSLDYFRFRPRGFYTRSTEMERYFRTVSWLQAIPFWIDKEEDVLAAVILYRASQVDPDDAKLTRVRAGKNAFHAFGKFLGDGDDWNFDTFEHYLDINRERPTKIDKGTLQWLLKSLADKAAQSRPPQVNDQKQFVLSDPKVVAEFSIRIAPAYNLPDAALFQRTTDPRQIKRPFPSGLDVAAALGSPFARKQLTAIGPKELPALIDANKSRFLIRNPEKGNDDDSRYKNASLYANYLDALQILLTVTEPDSPEFLKSEAWHAKTCQTALSGWAQMRHTWVLQAKLGNSIFCSFPKPRGFVEPVPQFYQALSELCDHTSELLDQAGAYDKQDSTVLKELTQEYAADERLIDILEKSNVLAKGIEGFQALSDSDQKSALRDAKSLNKDLSSLKTPAQFKALMDELRKHQRELERQADAESSPELKTRWAALRKCCAQLERMSHKQLRGCEFNADDNAFLEHYGEKLGWIMFYESNSYIHPFDDAPRIVDVFSKDKQHLEVGIGRPKRIYVLYPWHGTEILCHGAVIPYHEFTSGERLTDEHWRKLPAFPAQPAWTNVLKDGIKK